MMFKFLASIACILAMCHAGVIHQEQQEEYTIDDDYPVDFHAHPKYEFSYGVKDEETGDEKSQTEVRDGDIVRGSYTVMDPDGHRRIVEYTAGGREGFKAVVRREPTSLAVAELQQTNFDQHNDIGDSYHR